MKKILVVTCVLTLSCFVYFTPVSMAADRVTLCHNPPGDSDNWHTISVLDDDVQFHLDHGDLLDECPSDPCAASCDDGNPCTVDGCDENGLCTHTAVDCNDGKNCTKDYCTASEDGTTAECHYDFICGEGEECGYNTGECVACPSDVRHAIDAAIGSAAWMRTALANNAGDGYWCMLFDMYDQFPFWPDDLQPVNLAGRYGYPSQPPLPSNGVSTLWHIDLAWDVSDQIQKCLGPHNPNGYYYDMVPQWITKVYRGPLNYRLDDTVTGIGGGIHADLFCDTCDLFGECADAIPLTLIDQQIACARKVAQQLSDFGEPCLVQGVDIAAGIVCPDQVTAGENASYTVTVINGGSEPALDVSVTYTVPECAQFEGSNPTPDSINGNVVTWELGNILAGASIEISIIVDVDENCSNTTLVSDVSVTTISAEGGQGAENNSASCSSVFQLPSTP